MMTRLCLDPAHGYNIEQGMSGRYSFESDIVLAICRFAQEDLINAGHQVMLTREEEDLDLGARVQMAIDWTAKIFLSVHVNSASAIEAEGLEVFTSRGHCISDAFADILVQELEQTFSGLVRRGLREIGFDILKGPFPSAMVEWGFIPNINETAMKGDVANQRAFGSALARAVQRFTSLH